MELLGQTAKKKKEEQEREQDGEIDRDKRQIDSKTDRQILSEIDTIEI